MLVRRTELRTSKTKVSIQHQGLPALHSRQLHPVYSQRGNFLNPPSSDLHVEYAATCGIPTPTFLLQRSQILQKYPALCSPLLSYLTFNVICCTELLQRALQFALKVPELHSSLPHPVTRGPLQVCSTDRVPLNRREVKQTEP